MASKQYREHIEFPKSLSGVLYIVLMIVLFIIVLNVAVNNVTENYKIKSKQRLEANINKIICIHNNKALIQSKGKIMINNQTINYYNILLIRKSDNKLIKLKINANIENVQCTELKSLLLN